MKRLVCTLLLILSVNGVYAAQTKYVSLKGADVLSKGDFTHTQLDMHGNLSLAPSLEEVFDTKNLLIQSSMKTSKGVYFSTAKDAGLFFYDPKTKDTKRIYENSQSLSIPTFAIAGNTLYFVESPSNMLYSIDVSKSDQTPQKIRELDFAEYVWQIAVSGKSLYLATGGKAALYELPLGDLDSSPKEIFQNLEERHFLSMTISGKTAYLGGEGLGGVYKVDLGTKKTNLLYKTYEGTVSDMLLDRAGNLLVTTSNKEPKPEGEDFDYTDTLLAAETRYQIMRAKLLDAKARPREGDSKKGDSEEGLSIKNSLYEIKKNGSIDKLLTLDNTGLNTLFLSADGNTIFVGTSRGRVFQFDRKNRMMSLLVTLDDEDVTRLLDMGKSLLVMSSNIGQLYLLDKNLSKTGTYISDVVDLGNTGMIGNTKIESFYPDRGDIKAWIRGGQTEKVDKNWTDWRPLSLDKNIGSSLGKIHYLQYKVQMTRKKQSSPSLSHILTAYLPDNRLPSISLFSVLYDDQQPMAQKQNLQIRWNATDTDKDQLVYRIFFQEKGDLSWSLLLESSTADKTTLDTRVLPDGVYQFKLEVSDELDNGKQRMGKVSQLSPYILVGNTPPVFALSSVKQYNSIVAIRATVSSKTALIGKIYYKLGVDSNWVFVVPDSQIYDSKKVTFTVRIPKTDLKEIENSVFIRAFDVNMNQISYRVRLNRQGQQIK